MKARNIIRLIIIIAASALTSCTYDYDRPDIPNMSAAYELEGLPYDLQDEIGEKLKEAGSEVYMRGDVKYEPVVFEKDQAGKILYQGEPRNTSAKGTAKVEVEYKAVGYVSGVPQEVTLGYVKFSKSFAISVSPVVTEISFKKGDTFTIDTSSGSRGYYLTNNFSDVIEQDVAAIGYESPSTRYIVEELDSKGRVLEKFEEENFYGYTNIATDSATAVRVTIKVSGWASGAYGSRADLFTYTFSPVTLNPLVLNEIVLSKSLEYTRTGPDYASMQSYYSVTDKFTKYKQDLKDAGYTYYGRQYDITEKDKNGKVLKKITNTYMSYSPSASAAGATSIDVDIIVTGYIQSPYDYKKVYKYTFSDIAISPKKVANITLTDDMPYTRTKL